MLERDDPGGLGGDVVVNAIRYVLAQNYNNRPGAAWGRVEGQSAHEGDVGEEVTAVWREGWYGGLGEISRTSPDSIGHAFTTSISCAQPWYMRLGPSLISVTPVTNPTDLPTYFFEDSSTGTSYVYCVQGQRCWKMRRNSDNTITMMFEKDFGAGASAGMPARFNSLWFVPLGETVVFIELTTVTDTVSADDTWTNAAASNFARHFATYQDGATAKLAKADNTNEVNLASTAPRVLANWGSAFQVGDTSSAITGMVDTGIVLYVGKTDGLYRFDGTGNAYSILPLPKATGDSTNGVGMYAVPQSETCIYNHQSGLWAVDGDRVGLIGPDEIYSYGSIANVSAEPFRGRHLESCIYGKWIWSIYFVAEGGTNYFYHLAGYMRRSIFDVVWHNLARHTTIPHRGSFMDSGRRWWGAHSTELIHLKAGVNGSPDPGRDSIGYGRATSPNTGICYLPEVPFYRANGEPVGHTLKQLNSFEVTGRNLDATTPVQLQVQRDQGTVENVGATITASGLTRRFWTAGSSDTAYIVRPIISITPTASYVNTTGDPQIWSVILRARLRPDLQDVIRIVLDCDAPYSNGENQINNAATIRSNLLALESGASVTATDPDGNSLTLNIISVSDLEVATNRGFTTHYLHIEAKERLTS